MARRIIVNRAQLQAIRESSGDITIQDTAPQQNAASYQQTFNNPENQSKIRQADAMGGNVNFRITNSRGTNDNDMVVSVDGKEGLENMNDATKNAVSNGADVVVNSANKVNEGILYSKQQINEMRLKIYERDGEILTKSQLEELFKQS